MPGRSRASVLWPEAIPAHRAGPVALHENIGARARASPSVSRPLGCRRSMEAESLPRPLSITSGTICGRCARRDQHHVGAMCGERAPAHRTRDHAREVEHAHAGERTLARRQRLRRRVADLFDREDWEGGDRASLRMRVPLGERARHGDDQPGLGGSGLEFFAVPASSARCTDSRDRARSRAASVHRRDDAENSCAAAPSVRRRSDKGPRSCPTVRVASLPSMRR